MPAAPGPKQRQAFVGNPAGSDSAAHAERNKRIHTAIGHDKQQQKNALLHPREFEAQACIAAYHFGVCQYKYIWWKGWE